MRTKMKMKLKQEMKDESGAVIVLFVFILVIMLGFSALVIDLGSAYVVRTKTQQACDAAALGAARALPNETKAQELAKYYVEENGLDGDKAIIEIVDAGQKISIKYNNNVNNRFATLWGNNITTVACESEATVQMAQNVSGTFDYAIFSASETIPLQLQSGQYYVEGKIHGNATLTAGGGSMQAVQITSVKGGTINKWVSNMLVQDANGNWVKGPQAADKPEIAPVVEVPYYLGDAMEKLVNDNKPTGIPGRSYWNVTLSGGDLGAYGAGTGTSFKQALADGKNIKLTNPSGTYMNYALNGNGDLLLECSSSKRFQPSTPSTYNGDIYINGTPGQTVGLYFPSYSQWSGSPSYINGDIYCMSGDLQLGNVIVNGNVYCEGKLSTDGGKTTIIGTYVYANSIQTANDTEICATIVAENDIQMIGGQNTAKADSTLCMYSKNGNIKFATANSDIYGIIFAPKGAVESVGNIAVHGSIIGNEVKIYTGGAKVYPLDRDLNFDASNPNGNDKPGAIVKLTK